jgi:hypothetical protein
MPDVEILCCPDCKEKSTMKNNKLINKSHELRGGELSRFGGAVEKGEILAYYHCKICDIKWDRSELETTETEWATVSWIDPNTGKTIIIKQKKGSKVPSSGRKKSGKTYWKKQDDLLKRLREK